MGMITHEELKQTPEYWTAKIQIELFNKVEEFMENNNMNRARLAEKLGVSKSYVTQLLSGDFDHRLSKLIELSLAIGYYPRFDFEPVESKVKAEQKKSSKIQSKLPGTDYPVLFPPRGRGNLSASPRA